mgnify:CR=1 FL=1
MQQINQVVKFLQDNWLTIVLIVAGLIVLLKAIADFRVDWAKTTADKSDDVEAHLFKARVNVFVKALKNIFKIKSKKDAGFFTTELMIKIAVGAIVLLGLLYIFNKPAKIERNVEIENQQKQEIVRLKAQILELESYKKKSEEYKKLISKERQYYANGNLKFEKDIIDESNDHFIEEIEQSQKMNIDYQNLVSEMSEHIDLQEKIKNSQIRVDGRAVYDSDRGLEYEGSVAQSFYSASSGVNPEKKTWRAGLGLGFSY